MCLSFRLLGQFHGEKHLLSLRHVVSLPELLWAHFEKSFPALGWYRKGCDHAYAVRFIFNLP